MNIKYLRHFLALAEELHFGRAAKRLNMEQAPLSQSIKRFEIYLGGPLFDRSSRTGIRLTRLGEDLLPSAVRLVDEFELTMLQTRHQASGEQHPVRLGFVTTGILDLIPRAMRKLQETTPSTRVQLREASTTELLALLNEDELDICLTLPDEHPPKGVSLMELKHDRTMLAISIDNPLAAKKKLRLEDLRDESLIFFPQAINPYLHKRLSNYFAAHGVNFRITQEVRLTTSMLALVSANLGICFVQQSAALLPFPNVVLRDVEGLSKTVTWPLMLSWKPKLANASVQNFVNLLQQIARA